MKSAKDLLREAFGSVPNSFTYREVKFHIYQALQKLDKFEKRELSKSRQQQEQKIKDEERKKLPWMPPIYKTQETIDIIDKMIDAEKKIIEDIHNKGQQGETKNTHHDDEGLQTFHG